MVSSILLSTIAASAVTAELDLTRRLDSFFTALSEPANAVDVFTEDNDSALETTPELRRADVCSSLSESSSCRASPYPCVWIYWNNKGTCRLRPNPRHRRMSEPAKAVDVFTEDNDRALERTPEFRRADACSSLSESSSCTASPYCAWIYWNNIGTCMSRGNRPATTTAMPQGLCPSVEDICDYHASCDSRYCFCNPPCPVRPHCPTYEEVCYDNYYCDSSQCNCPSCPVQPQCPTFQQVCYENYHCDSSQCNCPSCPVRPQCPTFEQVCYENVHCDSRKCSCPSCPVRPTTGCEQCHSRRACMEGTSGLGGFPCMWNNNKCTVLSGVNCAQIHDKNTCDAAHSCMWFGRKCSNRMY